MYRDVDSSTKLSIGNAKRKKKKKEKTGSIGKAILDTTDNIGMKDGKGLPTVHGEG